MRYSRLVLSALALGLPLVPSAASAEPVTLRIATAAPEGTAWARNFHQMARDAEAASRGELTIRLYLGGIAGNEVQTLQRLRRGQLDAVMSGGMLCMTLSPSMRVLRLLGLFQSREEAGYVLGRLRPTIDQEFARAGFRNMGEAGLGSDMIFSRRPLTSMADLKRTRFWFWDLDEPMRGQLAAIGLQGVGLPLEDAGRAFDEKQVDAFLSVPVAALAQQWSAKTQYLSELRVAFLPACMVITNSAYDALSNSARNALTEASGKLHARMEELGRTQDAALLGGLFAKQGLKSVPVGPAFTTEFFDAARVARAAIRDKMIPGQLIDRVTGWLADYRAEYTSKRQP